MELIGYFGLTVLTISWLPQSIETIQTGKCGINIFFLLLVTIGSLSLAVYALSLGNIIFSILNILSTLGGLLNLFYKIYPRKISVLE